MRTLPLLALLALPAVASAIPITSFTSLLPGQPTPDLLHDVADAGDVDLDGFDDMLLGDPLNTPMGSAVLRPGGPPAIIGLSGPTDFMGSAPGDRFGASVDGRGDVNCDGVDDIVIGAPGAMGGNGAAYVFFGPIGPGVYPAGAADITLIGEMPGDRFGSAVAIMPDTDFDNCAEVVVGAPGHDPGFLPDAGAGYILFSSMGLLGPIPANAATTMKLSGDVAGEQLGSSVDQAGDFDSNGFQDAAFGSPGWNGTGAVRVALTPFRYFTAGMSGGPVTPVALTLAGEQVGDRFGHAVDGGGDADGDGRQDLLIGAPMHQPMLGAFQAGAAYAAAGSTIPSNPLGLIAPIMAHAEKHEGQAQGGQIGHDITFMGDLTGDGEDDWAMAAPYENIGAGTGRVYADLPSGPLLVGATLPVGGPSIDATSGFFGVGYAIDGGGNTDFDALPDPLIGFYYQPLDRNGLVSF